MNTSYCLDTPAKFANYLVNVANLRLLTAPSLYKTNFTSEFNSLYVQSFAASFKSNTTNVRAMFFKPRTYQFLIVLTSIALAIYGTPVSKTTSKHGTSVHQPTVKSPLGNVQGSILNTRLGKTTYAFRGIRYAKAPMKELRFQPPVAVEKWEGSFNATENGPACPQPHEDNTSEDCLILNVYSTKLPKGSENPKRPVIVFFHFGDLYKSSSSSDILGPQYLLEQDVVLVTPNYRLGALGFLSTGDKESPGNNGFKDQVEALRWVRDNIASFGGDPDLVTIAGYDAGGISVTLHLVSPMSKDLFHRAIAMSGSALGQLPVEEDQLDLAKKLAKSVGCPDDTSANIVLCLRTKTADELADSVDEIKEYGKEQTYLWLPVIEPDVGQARFLTEHPVHTIIDDKCDINQVPVLLGITNIETGYKAFDVVNNATFLDVLNKHFDDVSPVIFSYEADSDVSKTISKNIMSFYSGDKEFDVGSLPVLSQLYGDALSGFPVNRAAEIIAKKYTGDEEDVYYYLFNVKTETSNFYLPGTATPYGVGHLDDLLYLFQGKTPAPLKDDSIELTTMKKITLLWKNFAKTGKPIPEVIDDLDKVEWDAFETDSQKYMEISNGKLTMHEKLNEKRYSEWEKWFPLTKYQKTRSG